MELLAKVRQNYPQMVFLVVTGVDDIQVGIQAMRQGADDYLVKPLQVDANIVLARLTRALHVKRLEQEVENYRHHLEEIVSEQTQQLREALRQIERSYDHTLEVLGAAIDPAGRFMVVSGEKSETLSTYAIGVDKIFPWADTLDSAVKEVAPTAS